VYAFASHHVGVSLSICSSCTMDTVAMMPV
jgi:hypothetical protein